MSPLLARIAAPILPPELEQQFGEWRWFVGDDAEVLCMTLMGDWIFVNREGAICLLDTMEATIQVVAPTLEHLELLLDSPDERDALLLEGLALAVLAGQRLPAGHCVGYRVPPVLGGATDKSNLEVARAASYQWADCTKPFCRFRRTERSLVWTSPSPEESAYAGSSRSPAAILR